MTLLYVINNVSCLKVSSSNDSIDVKYHCFSHTSSIHDVLVNNCLRRLVMNKSSSGQCFSPVQLSFKSVSIC